MQSEGTTLNIIDGISERPTKCVLRSVGNRHLLAHDWLSRSVLGCNGRQARARYIKILIMEALVLHVDPFRSFGASLVISSGHVDTQLCEVSRVILTLTEVEGMAYVRTYV
jgi:hypothetical protein